MLTRYSRSSGRSRRLRDPANQSRSSWEIVFMPIVTPSIRAARALLRVESALRNWQDDPDSPRADVNKMLDIVADLRLWVQGHVLADIERIEQRLKEQAPPCP